jgi:integrase
VRDEFDMDAKVWIIPSLRMKGKKERKQDATKTHIVPLSDRALEILRIMEGYRTRHYPHVVFPSQGAGIHFKEFMGESNLVRVLKRHLRNTKAPAGADVHGMRTSLRSWAADNDFDPTVAEFCLAHVVGDKSENAYRRTSMIEKRRKLMDAWAAFCTGQLAPQADNVVPLRAVA